MKTIDAIIEQQTADCPIVRRSGRQRSAKYATYGGNGLELFATCNDIDQHYRDQGRPDWPFCAPKPVHWRDVAFCGVTVLRDRIRVVQAMNELFLPMDKVDDVVSYLSDF